MWRAELKLCIREIIELICLGCLKCDDNDNDSCHALSSHSARHYAEQFE